MNVTVKHNGTTITGYVIRYERVHKICTGVGTLNIEISDNTSRVFEPWDSIDIWENGDFKVRYYISSVEHAINRSSLVLDCQDNSKRIVDYFIPDSYTVDYPSYTRYWIEKFLTEAGVDYEFTTGSQGTLLSNFTNLGLATVYEQVLTLLQMSGWYMYFDGNGKAIIGSLNTDLAVDRASVGKTDVLSISVESNDKMLRNKALIFGAYDPFTMTNAKAAVSVHTPWNYDHNDLRTVVISNSNIPNDSTAYGMANQIIKEFARITVEKHITLWGARNFNLGTALRVTTNVYKGRGLITTFGVNMSKSGLITQVVLDERCPRLFGYFDFGDYVYVATYGDGTWRKHIKFDPTWYDFSDGYTNLNITDLHINNGVFGSVGASGEMFYAVDDLPWHGLMFSSFMSSRDNIVASGEPEMIPFSGLMARAVIVDKIGNTVKFGVDTSSGINYGDYFLMYSGMLNGTSVTSSGNRGWIVEYDVLAGDLGGTAYPISVSGNYNIMVLDMENDGRNDYVSVALGGGSAGPTTVGDDHNYGHHYTQPFGATKDYTSFTVYPDAQSIEDINVGYRGSMESITVRVQTPQALIAIDDQISGFSKAIAVGTDKVARKNTFSRVYDSFSDTWDVQRVQVQSTANSNIGFVVGIYPDLGADTYRIFNIKYTAPAPSTLDFYYIDWNATANTWGTNTLIQSVTLPGAGTGFGTRGFRYDAVVSGNTIYVLNTFLRSQNNSTVFTAASHLYINVTSINMETSTLVNDEIMEMITEEYETSGRYYYYSQVEGGDTSSALAITNLSTPPYFHIFQNGEDVQIIGRVEQFYNDITGSPDIYSTKEILFYGNSTVVQFNEIYTDTLITTDPYPGIRRFKNLNETNWLQLTETSAIIVGASPTAGEDCYAFDGTIFLTFTSLGGADYIPYHLRKTAVTPIFANNNNQYIAYDDDTNTFNICSAASLSVVGEVTQPANGTVQSFVSTGFGGFSASVWSIVLDETDFIEYMVPYNFSNFDMSKKILPHDDSFFIVPNFGTRTISFGNFFILDAENYGVVDPLAGIYYIDLGTPDWDSVSFLILQREGTSFTIIEEEAYPMREDISNSSPVLTVGSGQTSFVSNYVYDSSLTVVEPLLFSGRQVNDYRYSMLEPMVDGLVQSGYQSLATILYVFGSGIFSADALTYSGGFTQLFSVPSGHGTRIETSNYGQGGQYIFITASGDVQTFYQSDPASISGIAIFTAYSGMPQSRATIIRLDDSI